MGSVHLCTPLFFKDTSGARRLYESAKTVGMSVNQFGLGREWRGFVESKMGGLLDHIKGGVEEEYTLCVDATDTILVSGEKEIVSGFKKAARGFGVLVGGDKFCFPDMGLKAKLDSLCDVVTPTAFRYPCAGVVMGRTKELSEALRLVLAIRKGLSRKSPGYDDDQGLWQIAIANNLLRVTIDYRCELSVSMRGCKIGHFGRDGNRLIVNGNRPTVLHFCGRPKNKMRVYLGMCR